jgi:hypothetical protein
MIELHDKTMQELFELRYAVYWFTQDEGEHKSTAEL